MQTISGEEFVNLLCQEVIDDTISDLFINLSIPIDINLDKINVKITFSNIFFLGKSLRFYSKNLEFVHYINFINCTFNCNVNFEYCYIEEINFNSIKFNNSNFILNNCKINNFLFGKMNPFDEVNSFSNSSFQINQCEFSMSFHLLTIEFSITSKMEIKNSIFKNSTLITNTTFNNLIISHSKFLDELNYFNNNYIGLYNSLFFNNCEFNSSNYSGTNFNPETNFQNCKFLSDTKFIELGTNKKTTLKFNNCNFFSSVNFDKSKLHKILFENVKFNDISSFQDSYFDIFLINKTIFDKQSYFDNIQIKQIELCDRNSIRNIKLQLQKTDNKIDYNRFRIYEFNAYRKDIKKQLKEFKKDKNKFYHRHREPIQLKRDAFVLWLSDIVSEYGTDWKRAFNFTILFGLSAYICFYSTENFTNNFNLKYWREFIIGFFRFLLVTDFYNPLMSEKVYLTSPLSWFIFIFGKIGVAFGIYEMIQSFRKFRS